MLEPKKGAIALCAANILGLITSEKPDDKGRWTGIILEPDRKTHKFEFKKWTSSMPQVICYVEDLFYITTVEFIEWAKEFIELDYRDSMSAEKQARELIEAHNKPVEYLANGLYAVKNKRNGIEYLIAPLLLRKARELQMKSPIILDQDSKGKKRVRKVVIKKKRGRPKKSDSGRRTIRKHKTTKK